jgi:hypothetical protein
MRPLSSPTRPAVVGLAVSLLLIRRLAGLPEEPAVPLP